MLINETQRREDAPGPAEAASCELLTWLLHEDPDEEFQFLKVLDPRQQSGVYRSARISLENLRPAIVHVVSLDRASLLESWSAQEECSDYQSPMSFGELELTPVLSPERRDKPVAFSSCLKEASAALRPALESDGLDPITANIESMASDLGANSWCSLLRGAEIVSGSHFTYRELWSLFAHSTFGPVTVDGLGDLSDWISERKALASAGHEEEKVKSLVELGELRTHMLLFSAGTASSDKIISGGFSWPLTANEALEAVRAVDPLRDFGPFDGRQATEFAKRLHRRGHYLPEDTARKIAVSRHGGQISTLLLRWQ